MKTAQKNTAAHYTRQMKRKPNVIWIFGDQHRAQSLGYRGDPNVCTPNIDRLAHEGVRFDNAVSGAPWCTPFRGSLLTSQYPNNCVIRTPQRMDPNMPTVAHAFNDAGYHTAYVGKWHLDGGMEGDEAHKRQAFHIIPPERRGGFNYWMGYENTNAQYNCFVHGSESPEPTRLEGYETDALTDLFIEHMGKHVGENVAASGDDYQPFFSVLSVQPPHDPYVSPAEFARRHNTSTLKLRPNVPNVPWVREQAEFELAGYYGMIENLDYNLGRIREALSTMGIDQETHIFFFSDHGDSHGSHGFFRKSNPYEESIRIPCIVGGTSYVPEVRGARPSDVVFNHVDFAPTALDLCSIDVPNHMAGYSYAHCCDRTRPTPNNEPDSAYLQQCCMKSFPNGIDEVWRGVVTRDKWKYVCMPNQRWLMFNLNDDPYEQANLAFNTKFRPQRERLHGCLTDWIKHTGDTFAMPPMQGVTEFEKQEPR